MSSELHVLHLHCGHLPISDSDTCSTAKAAMPMPADIRWDPPDEVLSGDLKYNVNRICMQLRTNQSWLDETVETADPGV
eukprot:scaffold43796_cov41-Prasinocladus_malaysianus.AAC.2